MPVRFLFRVALALFAPILFAPAAAAQVAPGTVLDQVVAVVGDEPVLNSEVTALASQAAQGAAVTDEVWSRALDQIVDQLVLIARAEQDTTLLIADDQVTQELNRRIAEIARQLGGTEQLESYYGKPIPEVENSLREPVRRQLLAQQYQGRRLREVTITPSEVRTWFAQVPAEEVPEVPELVRVAHIVKVPTPDEAARDRARAFTEALRDSILADQATIEALARRHSADRGSAVRGGLIEDVSVRELVSEFGLVAGTLDEGAYSTVFETPFGFHVMRLNERRGDLLSFNHILIRVDDTAVDPEAAIAELALLRDSVVTEGVPFEAIAKRHSDDPFTAAQGGYLSDQSGQRDLQLDLLGDEWTETVGALAVGDVSEPAEVRLADGSRAWHLVLLQRRTPPHRLSPDTDYSLLSQYALRDKQSVVLNDWTDDLRKTVYIEIKTDRYVVEA